MLAQISIDRGPKETYVFKGKVLDQTDTHVKVQHGTNPDCGEWFARQSVHVHTIILGDANNPN